MPPHVVVGESENASRIPYLLHLACQIVRVFHPGPDTSSTSAGTARCPCGCSRTERALPVFAN